MAKPAPCRDCSEVIEVTPEKIEDMLRKLTSSRNVEFVDEEESGRRLTICRSCTAYAHGGTCMHCGCLVQIRTKIKGRGCPFPLQAKW